MVRNNGLVVALEFEFYNGLLVKENIVIEYGEAFSVPAWITTVKL